jgi:hypothetical protein
MSFKHKPNTHIFRPGFPSGHYDLVILSLVHQGKDIFEYMIKNIEKRVKGGSFLWVVHYNGPDSIDETSLPPWVWLVRNTIETERNTICLFLGLLQILKFALTTVSFTNAMTFSSGSVFFRDFEIPKKPTIALKNIEPLLNQTKDYLHEIPIPLEEAGRCEEYLKAKGRKDGWQYGYGGDKDTILHSVCKNRGFQYFFGCQWTGQVWPMEVAKAIAQDCSVLEYVDCSHLKYAAEEIYLSTYAYNYAIENNIPIDYVTVIIHWEYMYLIQSVEYIEALKHAIPYGAGVCKVPDVVKHPIRQALL